MATLVAALLPLGYAWSSGYQASLTDEPPVVLERTESAEVAELLADLEAEVLRIKAVNQAADPHRRPSYSRDAPTQHHQPMMLPDSAPEPMSAADQLLRGDILDAEKGLLPKGLVDKGKALVDKGKALEDTGMDYVKQLMGGMPSGGALQPSPSPLPSPVPFSSAGLSDMATQMAKQQAQQQIGGYEAQNQMALASMRAVPVVGGTAASTVEGAQGKVASTVAVCPVCRCHPDGTPKTPEEMQADAASEQKKAALQGAGKQVGAQAVDKAAAGYTGGASEAVNAASTSTGGKTVGGAVSDGYGDAGNDALARAGGCPACPPTPQCQPQQQPPPRALERDTLLDLLDSLVQSTSDRGRVE